MNTAAHIRHATFVALLYFIAAGSLTLIWDPVFPDRPSPASVRAAELLGWLMAALTSALLFLITRSHLRRQASLESATQQANSVIENAADGIITVNDHGVIAQFNPAAAAMFGCDTPIALGRSLRDFIPRPYLPLHPSYQGSGQEVPADSVFGREVEGHRADGTTFPIEMAVSSIGSAPHRLHIAIVRDISVRRKTERELNHSREQLRSLAARLHSVREEERSRLAREVHDELGQALTGVKMDLSWTLGRLKADQKPLKERIQSASQLLDQMVQAVRRIATELRPGVLDTLGLSAALEWQATEFTRRTGIPCPCQCDLLKTELSPEENTALFRIFQETLTNIARHAQATHVWASLVECDNRLQLSIRDDGQGIRFENITDGQSLGLLGIHERASMVGATVSIEGTNGHGTSVVVSVPLPSDGLPGQSCAPAA